jgi:hypothetical protein
MKSVKFFILTLQTKERFLGSPNFFELFSAAEVNRNPLTECQGM